MRRDIYERMRIMALKDDKPNFAEIARVYDCDYRTAKRFYENFINPDIVPKKIVRPSKLDPYKGIIGDKLEFCCSGKTIYRFIKLHGYTGKYSILRDYIKYLKVETAYKATLRFETVPGLQGQVDWKESVVLENRIGEKFTINIFLYTLGYSRFKYLELTLDKSQDTLIECLVHAFRYCSGVPKEILFDNMKTVVDHSKSNYLKAVINSRFYEFSKDCGFEVKTCRPFTPQTKGKVERVAGITNEIKVYNKEFDTVEDLFKLVMKLNYDINDRIQETIKKKPIDALKEEVNYLGKCPNKETVDAFVGKNIVRIVSKESLVVYKYNKYSVDPKFINKEVQIEPTQNELRIYYNKVLIKRCPLTNKKFNYDKEDYKKILHLTPSLKSRSDNEIEKMAEKNLAVYDKL